jgi:hypothetical protein
MTAQAVIDVVGDDGGVIVGPTDHDDGGGDREVTVCLNVKDRYDASSPEDDHAAMGRFVLGLAEELRALRDT